jgi:flavin-dependent dehydrogenase
VRLDSGEEVEADALFLATGKHELRGLARGRKVIGADPVVGFRAALPAPATLAEALDEVIELHLFDRGYAGLLLQDNGTANLCVSVTRDRLNAAGGISGLVGELADELPVLGRRLEASRGASWDTIAGVPYGWHARATEPGVFRLGDQGAVIASLAGDGIAMALISGLEAAAAFRAHGPAGAPVFQASFSRRVGRQLAIASALRRAAEHGVTRRPLLALLSMAPSLARLAARLTRVGD